MTRARALLAVAIVLPGAAIVAFALSPLPRQLAIGAAVAAKMLCTLEFVSGIDGSRARELYVAPLLRGGDAILRFETDRERGVVTVRVPGVVGRRAIHRPGFGCTLHLDEATALEALPPRSRESSKMALDADHRDAVFAVDALEAAVAGAFQQGPGPRPLNTLAVVVLHDGKLVAERYAQGITPETRLPGWSMTKSVTATLVGVLAQRGRVDVHAPGAIHEWRGTDDPRAAIALDHLLRMSSGLLITEAAERGDGLDPNSLMLYREADAARFAATRELAREVGSHFEYMSGNTVLAMRAAQEAIGGDLGEAHEFLHENLFAPLGMEGAVVEPDQAGTFIGSSHMVASARDWARFGQLYVDGGMAGGRRLVPEGWLDYVTTPTEASMGARRGDVFWEPGRSAYGAGFWLLGDGSRGLPRDSFDANGFQGQHLHIIPSRKLVVVRLGATSFRGHDHDRLPREVVAAMKRDGSFSITRTRPGINGNPIADRQDSVYGDGATRAVARVASTMP